MKKITLGIALICAVCTTFGQSKLVSKTDLASSEASSIKVDSIHYRLDGGVLHYRIVWHGDPNQLVGFKIMFYNKNLDIVEKETDPVLSSDAFYNQEIGSIVTEEIPHKVVFIWGYYKDNNPELLSWVGAKKIFL